MFPYYPIYYHFPHSFYGMQNHSPIATFGDGQNFQYPTFHENVKTEQENQNPCQILHSAPSFKSEDEKPTIQPKVQTSASNELPEENSEILNCVEKDSISSERTKKTKLIAKEKAKDGKRKPRCQKKDKAYVAKQYPKQEPSINCRYIQKNFELNIINQVFSFLWSEEKSSKFVKKFLKSEIKVTLYYEYIKIVRKFCKRYINKEYLKNLSDYQNQHIAYKMVSKNSQKLAYLSMGEFSGCVRHLIFIYLHQLCPQAILTSKKMRRQIWGEHLIKCRLLREYMFNDLGADEYERELIHSNRAESGSGQQEEVVKESEL